MLPGLDSSRHRSRDEKPDEEQEKNQAKKIPVHSEKPREVQSRTSLRNKLKTSRRPVQTGGDRAGILQLRPVS